MDTALTLETSKLVYKQNILFVEQFTFGNLFSNIKAQNKLYNSTRCFCHTFQIKIAIEPGAFHYIPTDPNCGRKFKNNNIDEFMNDLNLENIENSDGCLANILELFNTKITETLDIHAPLKEIKKGTKTTKTWFNDDLRKQRRVVMNHERIYRKYNEMHQWLAYKTERNRYCNFLKKAKTEFFHQMYWTRRRTLKHYIR